MNYPFLVLIYFDDSKTLWLIKFVMENTIGCDFGIYVVIILIFGVWISEIGRAHV